METGIVKWFSATKGCGFIVSDVDGGDLFVHFSEITEGRSLAINQRVEFQVRESGNGRQAAHIRPL